MFLCWSLQALSTTFTVTNINDSGVGSLRQAIIDANANTGADLIHFSISGSGVHTIALLSPLPNIVSQVTIDGYTQSGSSVNTSLLGNNALILIEINGNSAGIGISGLSLIAGSDNSIVRGLVINNFSTHGILVNGASNILISGCFIGTDASGMIDLGNGDAGIHIIGGANNNIIGGTTANARNIISGNNINGILLNGTSNNTIQGNYIGVDVSSVGNMGNMFTGIVLENNSDNNLIGGTVANAGNIIAFQSAWGMIVKSDCENNAILGNVIFDNGILAIDLDDNGNYNTNDIGDGDIGANQGQNFPEFIGSAVQSGSDVIFTYKVTATTINAAYPIRVEFFKSDRNRQGKIFLGFNTYTAGEANTDKTLTFTPTITLNIGDKITATATDANGNTSEFSEEISVILAGMQLYYPFSGNANDASGNNKNGTVVGATLTTDRFGKSNAAYYFDGTGVRIDVDNTFVIPNNNFTYALWVQPDIALPPSGYANFISKHSVPSDCSILIRQFGGQYRVEYNIGNVYDNISFGTISVCAWDFITITYNGSQVSAYLNGALLASKNASGTVTNNAFPMRMGVYTFDLNNSLEYYKGKLDEIQIYNHALSNTEITNLYDEGSLNVINNQNISGTYRNLTIQAGITATVPTGQTLTITGNITNNGSLNVLGNIIFTKSASTQNLNGSGVYNFATMEIDHCNNVALNSSVTVRQLVNMKKGNLLSNGNLVLASNATSQAVVRNNGTAQIQGNVSIQRYVPAYGLRTTVQGYNYFSSPISGKTINEFNDDVALVLNPAYDWVVPYTGAFPNFYKYTESKVVSSPSIDDIFEKGWESPTTTSENLEVGRGYILNLNSNTTIDFFGQLNNGSINIPITKGNATNSGWNLIGNPYPSSLDWNLIFGYMNNASKLENATIYRRIATAPYAGIWATYDAIAMTGTNGGTKDIALGQGFFIKKLNMGNDNLELTNDMRVYNNPQFFRIEEKEKHKTQGIIKIKLSSQKWSDETVLFFNKGASDNFDKGLDVPKIQLNSNPAPSLYTSIENKKLVYNALPIENLPRTIPLHFYVASTGTHEISLSEQRNLRDFLPIYLEDKKLNIVQDLTKKAYNFTASAGTDTSRFVLRFDLAFAKEIPDESLLIFPNPTTDELKINIDNQFKGKIHIRFLDIFGREVSSQIVDKQFVIQEFSIQIGNLPIGIYFLEIEVGKNKQVKKIVKN
jgi:hypothetical protein